MSVTQCYLARNDTHFIRVSTHLYHFQVIECDVLMYMFRPPLIMIVYVQLFWSAVLC